MTDSYSVSAFFKKNVNEMFDMCMKELQRVKVKNPSSPLNQIPTEMILFSKNAFFDPVDSNKIVETYLKESYPLWDKIKERDEKALVDSFLPAVIKAYPIIGSFEKKIRDIVEDPNRPVSKEFMDNMWERVDDLIRLSIRYVHFSRSPVAKDDGTIKYTRNFFSDCGFSVREQTSKWEKR